MGHDTHTMADYGTGLLSVVYDHTRTGVKVTSRGYPCCAGGHELAVDESRRAYCVACGWTEHRYNAPSALSASEVERINRDLGRKG